MYRCETCGLVFDQPFIREGTNLMPDCFRERFKQVLCPGCCEPYFEEITTNAEEDEEDGGTD